MRKPEAILTKDTLKDNVEKRCTAHLIDVSVDLFLTESWWWDATMETGLLCAALPFTVSVQGQA